MVLYDVSSSYFDVAAQLMLDFVVARLGGDEFAVIAAETSSLDGYRLATRLRGAVRQIGAGDAVGFTVSDGLAEALPGEQADAWFARADRALYEAKAEGRPAASSSRRWSRSAWPSTRAQRSPRPHADAAPAHRRSSDRAPRAPAI
jgi:GGDEF domain-containing protein